MLGFDRIRTMLAVTAESLEDRWAEVLAEVASERQARAREGDASAATAAAAEQRLPRAGRRPAHGVAS
jgi:hypothetical protein